MLKNNMGECKNCEYCNMTCNTCLLTNEKCYKDGKPLQFECKSFEKGKWCEM